MVILSFIYIMRRAIIYILMLILIIYICISGYKKPIQTKEGFSLCSRFPDYCNKKNIIVNTKNKTLSRDGITLGYDTNFFNDPESNYTCNEKDITSTLLSQNNISVPNFYVWDKKQNILNNVQYINKNLKFPLVVKPTIGTQGYGIKTNIKNNNDLTKQVQFLLDKQNKKNKKNNILIEEQISGKDFRITVYKGDIIGIVKRDSPYVIGNSKKTLSELINEHKYSKYKPHNIDKNLLTKQNVDFETIIPANKKIILSTVNNFHNGASLTNIPLNTVHPDNLYMFKRTNQILKKKISGIDYISDNIAIPYYQQGAIIEVNEAPDKVIHTYAFNYDEKKNYLDTFFNKFFN